MFTPTKEMLESIGMNEYCDSSWSIMNPFYPQSLDDAKKMIDLLTKK